MKESKSASRQERLEIVNEIMNEIASRGRKFITKPSTVKRN
jgi:hypothetical protein